MGLLKSEKSEVLNLLRRNLSTEEIAKKLGVPASSVRAVKAHITMGTYGPADSTDVVDPSADLSEAADALGVQFEIERALQQTLRSNLEKLEAGLTAIDGGKERIVDAGRIDICAKDQDGTTVVIELKAGEADRDAVAQVLSYMGALDEGRKVRGILVAAGFPRRTILAAKPVPNLSLRKYSITFSFESPE
jgi:hypothetical protein